MSLVERLDKAIQFHAAAGRESLAIELAEIRIGAASLESELAEAQFGFERELALKQELAAHVVVLRAENARLLADNATLRSAAIEACDLLTERRYGSSARSPSHNARLVLEVVIGSTATTPAQAEKLADYWSDWLIDAVGGATQNRALLRGEPTEDKILTEAIVLNGKKAIVSAVNAALAGHEQAGATAETSLRGNCWCEAYTMADGYPHRPTCTASPGKGGE